MSSHVQLRPPHGNEDEELDKDDEELDEEGEELEELDRDEEELLDGNGTDIENTSADRIMDVPI